MGKLNIPQELSDKISKSLGIKKSDIVDSGGNKPIIREPKRNQENKERDSPVKRNHEATEKRSQEHRIIDSPKKNPVSYTKKIFYKSCKKDNPDKPDKPDKPNKLDYIKISKIVFISSIVGGIGITLGIKLGTILFL